MNKAVTYNPPGTEWMERDFQMSPAIHIGGLVWLSGVGVLPQPGESVESAFNRGFETIQEILNAAGLDWNNVIDLTTLHVDLPSQREAILKTKNQFITKKPYPSWTAIEVKGLWLPELIAEFKVVASADKV